MKKTVLKVTWLLFSVRVALCILMVMTFATGCDTYRRLKKTIKGQKSLVYAINTTGTTDQTGYIFATDIIKDLGDEIGLGTVIQSISVASLSIEMAPNAANTADAFRILSLAVTGQSIAQFELLSLSKLPTTAFPLNSIGTSLLNNLLLVEGVDGLNKELSSRLVGKTPGNVDTSAGKAIGIRLRGTNIPANSRVAVNLTIHVDVTIEYSTCELVPDILFSDTPQCQ